MYFSKHLQRLAIAGERMMTYREAVEKSTFQNLSS